MSVFIPQVEPYVSDMCFLPASPLELGRDTWTQDIDVIFGGCATEGLLYAGLCPDEQGMSEINKNYAYLLPRDLFNHLGLEKGRAKGTSLKQVYFGDKDISRENLAEYLSVSNSNEIDPNEFNLKTFAF